MTASATDTAQLASIGQGAVAIGDGILKSIDAIAQTDQSVAPSVTDATGGVEPTPVPKGAYAPDIVVLLTDGVATTGVPPLDAAQQAVDRGVRVYTIGFGTENGQPGFGFGGGRGPFGGVSGMFGAFPHAAGRHFRLG